MNRMMIPLEINEKDAIIYLAAREKRDPRQQAALLIRQALERAGLLPATDPAPQPESIPATTTGQGAILVSAADKDWLEAQGGRLGEVIGNLVAAAKTTE